MRSPLRIASIGYASSGGAGMSALKLHREFLRLGQDARFFVLNKRHEDVGVVRLDRKHRDDTIGFLPTHDRENVLVATGHAMASAPALEQAYEWADVVLLRWTSGVVSDHQLAEWCGREKPLVWCLSDMAPMTGGCHYAGNCTGYHRDCARCPLTTPQFSDLPERTLARRTALWRNITVVSPSRWLADEARYSRIFRHADIRRIRTGVELDVFRPQPMLQSRRRFGLPENHRIVLAASHSTTDPRKGFDLMQQALAHAAALTSEQPTTVVTAGHREPPPLPFPSVHVGYVGGRDDLAQLYAAADVTALPYREDNLPNVLLESLACGTPVMAFAVGGMPDVIASGFNGTLIEPFDTAAFGSALVTTPAKTEGLSSRLRCWAEGALDLRDQAEAYMSLFGELLDGAGRSARCGAKETA